MNMHACMYFLYAGCPGYHWASCDWAPSSKTEFNNWQQVQARVRARESKRSVVAHNYQNRHWNRQIPIMDSSLRIFMLIKMSWCFSKPCPLQLPSVAGTIVRKSNRSGTCCVQLHTDLWDHSVTVSHRVLEPLGGEWVANSQWSRSRPG